MHGAAGICWRASYARMTEVRFRICTEQGNARSVELLDISSEGLKRWDGSKLAHDLLHGSKGTHRN